MKARKSTLVLIPDAYLNHTRDIEKVEALVHYYSKGIEQPLVINNSFDYCYRQKVSDNKPKILVQSLLRSWSKLFHSRRKWFYQISGLELSKDLLIRSKTLFEQQIVHYLDIEKLHLSSDGGLVWIPRNERVHCRPFDYVIPSYRILVFELRNHTYKKSYHGYVKRMSVLYALFGYAAETIVWQHMIDKHGDLPFPLQIGLQGWYIPRVYLKINPTGKAIVNVRFLYDKISTLEIEKNYFEAKKRSVKIKSCFDRRLVRSRNTTSK
ncbi:hypothetical protein [Catenovulum sediminis]|uniref:Uncharacterized protein n=1 Tax=Catenovulum sediminis TaxID=1740262 RepID=A0ABV1RLF1_9ALTE|nr:hypothetical protein [Catenovulum sediminis]